MNGLLGYIGNRVALPVLMQGLRMMKNSVYSSSGVILKTDGKFYVKKVIGQSEEMEKEMLNYPGTECIGILHMRWPSRGDVSEANTHPMFDCSGKIAVMHKGIIDNFLDLKEDLVAEGHVFTSQTDSEVLAHLIEKYYTGDLSMAVREALKKVQGTYGLIVLFGDEKMELVAANCGADMYVGVGEGEYWVALNEGVIYPFTNKIIAISDNEMIKIDRNGFIGSLIEGGALNVVNKTIEILDTNRERHVEYYQRIEKEIVEQPQMVAQTIAGRINKLNCTANFGGLAKYQDFLRESSRLIFVGAGSSYLAALMAREWIEDYAAVAVSVYTSMEMKYKRFLTAHEKTAMFAISQSGDNEDTLAAVREAKQLGMTVLGITNKVASPLAKEVDSGLYLHSGPTLGMPSMRQFMSQLTGLLLLTLYIGRLKGLSPVSGKEIILAMQNVPNNLKKILSQSYNISNIVKKYQNYKYYMIAGFRYGYPLARESSLLLGRMSKLAAVATHIGQLDYGVLERVTNEYVIFYLWASELSEKVNSRIISQIKKKGAKVIVIGDETNIQIDVDEYMLYPKVKDIVRPLMMLMVLQLWIYYLGKDRKILQDNWYNENVFGIKTDLI